MLQMRIYLGEPVGRVTYAAQTSLEADDSGQAVDHPLVEVFFAEFNGQAYVRNERAWSA